MRSYCARKILIGLIISFLVINGVSSCDNGSVERRIHHRIHHRRHFKRNNINHESFMRHQRNGVLKKRCRYSENDPHEASGPLASKPKGNFKPYNFIKHHQIRDGQERSQYSSSNVKESNSITTMETERKYVNIGDQINLTCNINTREIDWHFKDTNLTTTILSYGLQLQIRQPIIYQMNQPISNINRRKFESDSFEHEPIIKYKLSSDMKFKHQLTLYVESRKDEGSYQCVDSTSDSPVKKTIHVILKTNSAALKSGFNRTKISTCFFVLVVLFPFINFVQ